MSKPKQSKKALSKTQKQRGYYTDWAGEKFTKEDNITNDFLIEMTNGKGDGEIDE